MLYCACRLIKKGLPTLFVRRLFQTVSFLGCGFSVLPLAISADPGLMPAVLCLTGNLVFYSLSYGGFHAYLQDVAGKHAGMVQGLTNSASIACGIAGNLFTGMVVDVTGSFRAVFWVLFALYVSAAGVWVAFSREHKLVLRVDET
jgi:MFS family permease